MKKIFALLFSIAFLLVFVSLFSQKSLADVCASTGCPASSVCDASTTTAGGCYSSGAGNLICRTCSPKSAGGGGQYTYSCGSSAVPNSKCITGTNPCPNNAPYTVTRSDADCSGLTCCQKPTGAGSTCNPDADPCTSGSTKYWGGVCNCDKTILFTCGGTAYHGTGVSTSHKSCACIPNLSGQDYCGGNPAPPPPAPPAPPTCTAKTGDWGTCTGVNACSTTGSRTRTNTNANCTTVNETDSSCALTPPASCNKPTVPSLTCTTATPTTASLSWANGTNTTETVLSYCDRTKAAAHSPAVSCTKDSQATSDGSQAGWYLETGNINSTSPQTITGLTADHEYTAFIRAYNGNHATSTLYTDSADINFTGGSCTSQPGLALAIGLDGIGTTGDQVNADWTTKTNTAIINGQSVTNPVAGSNQDPKNPTRLVTLYLTSAGSATPITLTGNVTFVPSGTNVGKYTGTIPYGTTVKAGTYTVKVTVDGHLTKLVPGTVTVANVNTTATVPLVDLVTGDIATPNALAALDYNVLLSCISDSDYRDLDAHAACNANGAYRARADLEDNGVIDKFDYNLFLREFSKIQAGD